MIRPNNHRWAAALGLSLATTLPAAAQNTANLDEGQIFRATQIVGMKVQTNTGERLGAIENVAVDTTDGMTIFAIIESNNVQGVKDKLTAVPFLALDFGKTASDPAKLDITVAKFDERSSFNPTGWNTIGDRSWGEILYRTWGLESQWTQLVRRSEFDRTPQDPGRRGVETEIGPDGKPRLPLVKITEVIGRDVRTNEPKDAGKIEDLGVNVGRDKVVFAVIDGIPGMEGKMVAVPFSTVNLSRQDKTVVVRADREKIKSAPAFESRNWPNMADARWSKQVRDHFGAGANDGDFVYGYADNDDVRNMRGWEPGSEYNRKFDSARMQTFGGKVTAIDRAVPMSTMGPGVVIKVQADNDQIQTVHLGPVWFVDRQPNLFKEGDQVTVTGSRADIDGKAVILASEVERNNRVMVLRRRDGQPMWDAWRRADDRDARESQIDRDRDREGDARTIEPINPKGAKPD